MTGDNFKLILYFSVELLHSTYCNFRQTKNLNEIDGTEEKEVQKVNRFSGMLRTPIIGWIYNDILVYLEEIGSEKLINWFILYMGLISIMFFAGFALHTYQKRIQESTEDMLHPEESLEPWTYSIDQESNEDMLNPEESMAVPYRRAIRTQNEFDLSGIN